MDLSFRFDRMGAQALPGAPDIAMLLAGLAAEQASGRTAAAAGQASIGAPPPRDARRALIALFTGASDWVLASQALGGSFHPRIACAAAGKAGSTLMKPGFTFAF